ncbi:MAG: O-antigen ligase family protein [Gammaproteobacteria bacterium]
MDALLLIGVLGGTFFLFSLLAPRGWRFGVTLWSSVFQVYTVPVMGIYPPLTLLTGLALWPELVRRAEVLRWPPLRIFILLLGVHALSLAWSEDKVLGIRNIAYLLPFLTVFAAAYGLAQRRAGWVNSAIAVFGLAALIEAALVVLFRIAPDVEDAFLHSSIARWFITPNALDVLFDVARNNVLGPLKSGGFFTNANVASGFLGMTAFVCWGLHLAYRRRGLGAIAALLWLAIFFTGSKAGLMLALLLLFAGYLVWHGSNGPLTISRVTTLFGSLVAAVLVALGLSQLAQSDFAQESGETLDVRGLIWTHALHEFLAHPLLGQGFGGWETSFTRYAAKLGISESFPPHNTLIFLWSQSGILAALIGLLFMYAVLAFGVRTLRSKSRELQALGLGTTLAFLWAFIQGMGENWGIVGDLHMQPVLASALGLTYARYRLYIQASG